MVAHDKNLKGIFSETIYQVDVLIKNEKDIQMGEAKNYTIKGKNVERPDLQKLGRALGDLKDDELFVVTPIVKLS